WIGVPLFALATFLFLRRGFNYVEHLITYTFYLVLGNIVLILSIPLLYFDFYGVQFYFLIITLYFFYLYAVALKLNKWQHYLLLILANLFGFVFYVMVISFGMGIIYALTNQ
ncbi:hypothetical protein, partial [Fulvivirga aurantia]|uniref:hypothetical protein n=1 Tax=Fulvivirga aurantia TaxID=2529383 RepID=UPI001CA3B195